MNYRLIFFFLFFTQALSAQLNDVNSSVSSSVCDKNNDGQEMVSLTSFIPLISTNSSYQYSFYTTLSDAEMSANSISNSQLINASKIFYVRVFDVVSGNYRISTLTLSLTTCSMSVSEENQKQYKVYPNPVKDFLTIETNEKIDKIELYSTSGKIVNYFNENTIYLGNLPKGVYLIKMIAGNKFMTRKIIKD